MKLEVIVTSIYIVQSDPNFTCLIRVPVWRLGWLPVRHLLETGSKPQVTKIIRFLWNVHGVICKWCTATSYMFKSFSLAPPSGSSATFVIHQFQPVHNRRDMIQNAWARVPPAPRRAPGASARSSLLAALIIIINRAQAPTSRSARTSRNWRDYEGPSTDQLVGEDLLSL